MIVLIDLDLEHRRRVMPTVANEVTAVCGTSLHQGNVQYDSQNKNIRQHLYLRSMGVFIIIKIIVADLWNMGYWFD